MKKHIVVGLLVVAGLVGIAGPGEAQEREARRERVRAETAAQQGWLGIAFNYFREERGGRAREGAVVAEVHPGSPAARAGVQRGDTVVQLNGRTDVEAQARALRLQPGDTVRVRVRRAGERDRNLVLVAERRPGLAMSPLERGFPFPPGERFEFRRVPGEGRGAIVINGDTVRIPFDSLLVHADSLHQRIRLLITDSLGPRLRELERERLPLLREQLRMLDSTMVRAFPEDFVFEVGRRAVAGAEFTELNPELADYFDGVREGLLVVRVAPESPAARAGLRAGDVVVRANGESVRTTAELRRVVGRTGRDDVRLGVVRKGRQVELRLR